MLINSNINIYFLLRSFFVILYEEEYLLYVIKDLEDGICQ